MSLRRSASRRASFVPAVAVVAAAPQPQTAPAVVSRQSIRPPTPENEEDESTMTLQDTVVAAAGADAAVNLSTTDDEASIHVPRFVLRRSNSASNTTANNSNNNTSVNYNDLNLSARQQPQQAAASTTNLRQARKSYTRVNTIFKSRQASLLGAGAADESNSSIMMMEVQQQQQQHEKPVEQPVVEEEAPKTLLRTTRRSRTNLLAAAAAATPTSSVSHSNSFVNSNDEDKNSVRGWFLFDIVI